jgi:hypothetical protein
MGLGVLPPLDELAGVSPWSPPLFTVPPPEDVPLEPFPSPSPPDAECTGSVLGPVLLLQAAVAAVRSAASSA